MASHVIVLDSSYKRTQVKVTPGKYLREILEEACTARKWNPEQYTLKNNNKQLDLSQPFRLSGLSAGAKLQLTQASRSPSVVSVALQLPDSEGGTRLNDKFPSTSSLWLVLRKYEDAVAGQPSKKLNLTQRGVPSSDSGAGRLMYEQPCLHLAGRNLETFTDLQRTLGQLGLNTGSILIRLTYKSSERPLEQAMQEITEYFSAVDTVPAGIGSSASQGAQGAHAAANGTLGSIPSAEAENSAMPAEATGPEPSEDAAMTDTSRNEDTDMTPAPSADDTVLASSTTTPQQPTSPQTINGISVFRPPSSNTPAAAREPDDPSVFEPTVEHAKSHQAALQRSSRNQRLLSDKELEAQEETRREKLATVHNVTVRVRYPDQSMIEVDFAASETSSALYDKVRGSLQHADQPFELRFSGPKGLQAMPDGPQRLVRDLGFRGRVLVTMAWLDAASVQARQAPCLKEEYRDKAQELRVDLIRAEADRRAVEPERKEDREPDKGKGKGRGDVEAKMKKFLGFGKK